MIIGGVPTNSTAQTLLGNIISQSAPLLNGRSPTLANYDGSRRYDASGQDIVVVGSQNGQSSPAWLRSTSRTTTVVAGTENNTIALRGAHGGGNFEVTVGSGANSITAGRTHSKIYGSVGNDTIDAGSRGARTELYTSSGASLIAVGGHDTVHAGVGTSTIELSGRYSDRVTVDQGLAAGADTSRSAGRQGFGFSHLHGQDTIFGGGASQTQVTVDAVRRSDIANQDGSHTLHFGRSGSQGLTLVVRDLTVHTSGGDFTY